MWVTVVKEFQHRDQQVQRPWGSSVCCVHKDQQEGHRGQSRVRERKKSA